MIAQRLLDNARLIDELLRVRVPDPAWLRTIAAANRLRQVDLLDRDGGPYVPPRPTGPGGMRRMMGDMAGPPSPESHRAMMRYMWGPRWAIAPNDAEVPPAIRDRRFWQGSVFGVAVGARSFPGIIAIHADADYVLNFSKEIGVQHEIEELGRQAGIQSIALLDRDLTVIAHSDPRRLGEQAADPALREALAQRRTLARFLRDGRTPSVYEIARPLGLSGSPAGLLRIDLSTAPMDRVWQRDRLAALVVGLSILALGVLGMAAIFYTQHRHLAEIRRLETEMGRRERLSSLGNMAAAVAHEVRNPLNAVSMGLQRLRAEFRPAEADEYGRLVDLVQGEVRRLDTIVGEFLSLARPPSLRLEDVRVADLLDEVIALVEAEARGAGIRIERTVATGLPTLRADRDRLKQVLLNLVLNAIQAMPGGGRLGLEARTGRQAVTLVVADSGAGIPADVLPRVFEPYVTTKAKGLGLGLAIARQIVEAHGGTVAAESTAGHGSRFTVTLPRAGGEA
jgi:signal transduction histidine kinase